MTIKEFKRRWLNSKIEPELFYMPVKKKEIVVQDIYIYVHHKMWCSTTNEFVNVESYRTSYGGVDNASIVVLDSKDNVILNERGSLYSSHRIKNIKTGNYKVKVIRTAGAGYADNEWHIFSVDKNTKYVHVYLPIHILYTKYDNSGSKDLTYLWGNGSHGTARSLCEYSYDPDNQGKKCPICTVDNEMDIYFAKGQVLNLSIDNIIIYNDINYIDSSGKELSYVTTGTANSWDIYYSDRYLFLGVPLDFGVRCTMYYPYPERSEKLSDKEEAVHSPTLQMISYTDIEYHIGAIEDINDVEQIPSIIMNGVCGSGRGYDYISVITKDSIYRTYKNSYMIINDNSVDMDGLISPHYINTEYLCPSGTIAENAALSFSTPGSMYDAVKYKLACMINNTLPSVGSFYWWKTHVVYEKVRWQCANYSKTTVEEEHYNLEKAYRWDRVNNANLVISSDTNPCYDNSVYIDYRNAYIRNLYTDSDNYEENKIEDTYILEYPFIENNIIKSKLFSELKENYKNGNSCFLDTGYWFVNKNDDGYTRAYNRPLTLLDTGIEVLIMQNVYVQYTYSDDYDYWVGYEK